MIYISLSIIADCPQNERVIFPNFHILLDKIIMQCYIDCTNRINTVEGGLCVISINYKDARPIYEQIKSNICKLILSGAFPPDKKLPSVRELASQLAINPNTIQRAYRELEAAGYIVSVPGKGSFAADTAALALKEKHELYGELDAIITKLTELGATQEEITAHIAKVRE